jgi:hypothetical protein
VRNALVLEDTQEVLKPAAVLFSRPGGNRERLGVGTIIERVFREGTRVYGRILRDEEYGWINVADIAGTLRPVRRTPAGPLPGTGLADRVRRHLNDTNLVLREAYERMQAETGHRIPIPRWELVDEGGSFVCLLRNVDDPSAHAESSRLLGKILEQATLRSGRAVVWAPGRIEIR